MLQFNGVGWNRLAERKIYIKEEKDNSLLLKSKDKNIIKKHLKYKGGKSLSNIN